MKVLLLLLMHYVTGEGIADIKPKSVNVNFETVFEFNEDKNSAELKLIEKVQDFLSNVRVSLRNSRRHYDHSSNNESIKNYLEKAIKAVLDFRDNEMEDLIAILKKEIVKYSVLDKKVSYRRILAVDSDHEYSKSISVPLVRRHLENTLDSMDTLRGDEKLMLESVNSILKDKPKDKLDGFIQNLEGYSKKTKRDNLGLRDILRQGLKDLYVNYYINLDTNAKDIVSNIIKKIFIIFRSKFEKEDVAKELRKGNREEMSDNDVKSSEIKLPTPRYMNTYVENEMESEVTELVSSEFEATTTKPTTRLTTVKRKRKHKHKRTTEKSYMHSLWLEEINVHFETTKRPKRTKHKLRSPKQRGHSQQQKKRFRIKSFRDDDESKYSKKDDRRKKKKTLTNKSQTDTRKSEHAFGPIDHNSIESNRDEGLVIPIQQNRRMLVGSSTDDKFNSTTKYISMITPTTENIAANYERNNKFYNGYNNGKTDNSTTDNTSTKELLTKTNNYNKQIVTLPTTIKDKEQTTEATTHIVKKITITTEKIKETITTKATTSPTTLRTTVPVTTRKTEEKTTPKMVIVNSTVSNKVINNATLTTNMDAGKKNIINDVDNKINK